MDERFDLQKYLTEGVEQVIKDALKATLKDPRESAFLVKFAASCAVADKRREKNEKESLHVPRILSLASLRAATCTAKDAIRVPMMQRLTALRRCS